MGKNKHNPKQHVVVDIAGMAIRKGDCVCFPNEHLPKTLCVGAVIHVNKAGPASTVTIAYERFSNYCSIETVMTFPTGTRRIPNSCERARHITRLLKAKHIL
jgi:hypothetical protein